MADPKPELHDTPFGPVTPVETLIFYDRPLVYTAADDVGRLHLVCTIDEDGSDAVLLVARLGADAAKILHRISHGPNNEPIDLVFLSLPGPVYRVRENMSTGAATSCEELTAAQLRAVMDVDEKHG